jgi:hypothetical protein
MFRFLENGARMAGALALAAGAILGFNGCAAYVPQGVFEVTKTKVDLESNNFNVKRLGIQATAERPYILGIPLGPTAIGIPLNLAAGDLQARAWSDLTKAWDGQGSSVYHNIAEEWTAYGIPPIYFVHQYTVTADVYEFDSEYIHYATRGERGL